MKNSYKNNEFKISVPTWNGKFELPDGLYSVSYIYRYVYENIRVEFKDRVLRFTHNRFR